MTPPIQFGQAEKSGAETHHNDALLITTLLANNEVGRIFIDSGSSIDILFGEAYDQIQLRDIPLEKVNTSLYRFTGEIVHPRGMISLPFMLGTRTPRKTCMLKFLVVDVSSAYNAILGRPTINTFQAVIFTYHMKIKFPALGGMEEVQGDPSSHESVISKPYVKDKKEVPRRPAMRASPTNEKRKLNKKRNPRKGRGHPPRFSQRRIVKY
ncbi:UNVERIFIED_CONTAM: hypothetical protein Sradi_5410100 [Sesamum radiatum]|uniref:Uncharacterized protein n=1 Tax=Sesamum radiatum TaxID=300843 RepID=A0AAW2L8D2_SESRA